MILRFRHKGLERLFATGNASEVSTQHLRRIHLILAQLNAAQTPDAMNAPGLRFHALRGDRHEQFAVSVSGNWRIVFSFEGENATDIDFVDYH